MKQSDSEIVRTRKFLLIVMALVLAVAMIWTGYFGFLYSPSKSVSLTEQTETYSSEEARDNSVVNNKDTGLPGFVRTLCRISFFIFAILLAADLMLLFVLCRNIQNHERKQLKKPASYISTRISPVIRTQMQVEQPLCPIPGITLGKVHDMGRREYQQDSFGQTSVLEDTGLLTVLADGMGGLSNGERVSQRIVMEALNYGAALQQDQLSSAMYEMVQMTNQAVNQMLGPGGLYTSGSTVVSALIAQDQLWWVSVGDSRIYLYRDGYLSQLSRDHDLLQDWMPDILDGKRDLQAAMEDPDGRKLTSFIGMGELRHIDRNHTSIALEAGDRILLMSDGIYGTVSDEQMMQIMRGSVNVQDAASRIAQLVKTAELPYQDNSTLVILGYDPPAKPIDDREQVLTYDD